jgi:GNAT superfamily N-acetyltransferase
MSNDVKKTATTANIASPEELRIEPAQKQDVPEILGLIRELAEYEKLLHEVEATEQDLVDSLFGAHPVAEALMLRWSGEPAGYSIFFHNFSTFLGRPGLYVEDIYVRPQFRRKGIARAVFGYLANLAVQRRCGRLEWAVLDWNELGKGFYQSLGAELLPDWRIMRLTGQGLTELASIV